MDYIGIVDELKEALKTYTASKGKGRPTANSSEALAVLIEKMDVARGILHGVDYSGFKTNAYALLSVALMCAGSGRWEAAVLRLRVDD